MSLTWRAWCWLVLTFIKWQIHTPNVQGDDGQSGLTGVHASIITVPYISSPVEAPVSSRAPIDPRKCWDDLFVWGGSRLCSLNSLFPADTFNTFPQCWFKCWVSVVGAGPTFNQHWVYLLVSAGIYQEALTNRSSGLHLLLDVLNL